MVNSYMKFAYVELLEYFIMLKQFNGTWNFKEDKRKRSFESLSFKERINFVQICTEELNATYIYLTDFLVQNKAILKDYVKSIKRLMNYNLKLDKIVEIKRTLLEKSKPCFKIILSAILVDLRNIIKELSVILKISQKDTNAWLAILKDFNDSMDKYPYLYESLDIPICNAQKEIQDAIIQQKTKISDCKDMISYTTGESNYFPGEDRNLVEDLLGGPNEDVERYLRQLVNKNMARYNGSVEHLKIYQRSLEDHLAELEKVKCYISEIKLLNILFSKFKKTKIFDILKVYQMHLKNYNDVSKMYNKLLQPVYL